MMQHAMVPSHRAGCSHSPRRSPNGGACAANASPASA